MAPVEAAAPNSIVTRSVDFYHEVRNEMRKVTWPDWPQVRQLSIGVVALSLLIGGIIALMDVVLQQVLVRWLPALFGR